MAFSAIVVPRANILAYLSTPSRDRPIASVVDSIELRHPLANSSGVDSDFPIVR